MSDKQLASLYYDPEIGLGGVNRLFEAAKNKGLAVTRKQISEFVKNQQVSQLHQEKPSKTEYLHINSPEIDARWQADLIDLPKLSDANNGYRYILSVIDIYSRYGWLIPTKNKDGNSIQKAFQEIFRDNQPPSETLTTDSGTEFTNKTVQALLAKEEVKHYTSQTGDHNRLGMIERFNRTVKTLLARYMSATGSRNWVNVLPLIAKNYNNQVHSSTDMKPSEVKEGDIKLSTEQNPKALEKYEDFNVGDKVRILVTKNVFAKGYDPKWSNNVFIIKGLRGFSYELYSEDGLLQKKVYKPHELQKVSKISKVPRLLKEAASLRNTDLIIPQGRRTINTTNSR